MTATIWSIGSWSAGQGITLPADDLGCVYYIDYNGDTGWNGSPAARSNSLDRAGADGVYDAAPTQPGKSIGLAGRVWAPDQVSLHRAMDRLSALLVTGRPAARYADLVVAEAHLTRQARVRRDGETLITPTGDVGGKWEATFSLLLFAPDPIRYSATAGLVSALVYSGASGRAYPRAYGPTGRARAYGPLGALGQVTVVNDGNVDVYPTITFDPGSGVLVNPRARLVGGGQLELALSFDASAGPVVIDSANESVLQGGVSRRLFLTPQSTFWAIPAETTQQVLFTADSAAADSTMTVAWRDGYA